jgi:hypothetical protein
MEREDDKRNKTNKSTITLHKIFSHSTKRNTSYSFWIFSNNGSLNVTILFYGLGITYTMARTIGTSYIQFKFRRNCLSKQYSFMAWV